MDGVREMQELGRENLPHSGEDLAGLDPTHLMDGEVLVLKWVGAGRVDVAAVYDNDSI